MKTSLFSASLLALALGALSLACGGEEPADPAAPASAIAEQATSINSSTEGLGSESSYSCGQGGLFDEAGTCPPGTVCYNGECIEREPDPDSDRGHGGGGGHHGGGGGHHGG